MRVVEMATDRTAEVHVYVEGKVDAIQEYGEYIEDSDKAICCYIPVEEGHKIKIGGTFSGTTSLIAYDVIVDGIFRKAGSYAAHAVQIQKNKRFLVDKFLCKVDKGIIDTEMIVAPVSGVKISQTTGLEAMGTIELRLSITRQMGVLYTVGGIEKYYDTKNNTKDDPVRTASYKGIAPEFQMTFEGNAALLDKTKSAREQRKMNGSRPGTEPWAIFRFHYRSKEVIAGQALSMTFDPLNRAKTELHIMHLNPVPPLLVGTRMPRNDDSSSTRTSSPKPLDLPSILKEGSEKALALNSPTSIKKRRSKPSAAINTVMISKTEKESTTDADNTTSRKITQEFTENIRAQSSAKASFKLVPKEMPTMKDTIMPNDDANSPIPPSTFKDGEHKTAKGLKNIAENNKAVLATTEKPNETKKPTISDMDAVITPDDKTTGITKDDAADVLGIKDSDRAPTNVIGAKSTPQTTRVVDKVTQQPIMAKKKPLQRAKPASKPTTSIQIAPPSSNTTVAVTKRSNAFDLSTSPEPKRAKIVIAPPAPSILTTVPQLHTIPSTLSPMPIERQVAEQRMKLHVLREKRLETARKQSTIDKQLEPFQQRMMEELERLKQELMDEEDAYTKDEDRYSASVEMLAEFRKADRDT
ncbi:hypothetical protein BKA66DRAFT_487980 [Pyrenochaeta sp. MPI-SDFR-AT-0127]|nr:hypothetical protein BKA66DRAFT_487980 [Pyrenochaeta sp. MPI-SDFR-AT-0127]